MTATLGQAIPALPVRDTGGAVAFYLYDELRRNDVPHPVSCNGVSETDFGSREFATLDADGDLIEFFEWVEA